MPRPAHIAPMMACTGGMAPAGVPSSLLVRLNRGYRDECATQWVPTGQNRLHVVTLALNSQAAAERTEVYDKAKARLGAICGCRG